MRFTKIYGKITDINVKEFYTQDDFDGFVRIAKLVDFNNMDKEQLEKLRENYNPNYDFDKDMDSFTVTSILHSLIYRDIKLKIYYYLLILSMLLMLLQIL